MTDITYVKLASNGNSTSTHSKLVISSIAALPFYHYGRSHQSFEKSSLSSSRSVGNRIWRQQEWFIIVISGRGAELTVFQSISDILVILSPCHHLIEHFTAFPVSNRQRYLREHIQYYFFTTPHLDSIAASLFVWNWLSWQIVSDDKIQITILILRRGALSKIAPLKITYLKLHSS